MSSREARLRAQKKYDEAHKDTYKAYYFKCHKENDAALIDYLDSMENRQGTIKEILRKNMP